MRTASALAALLFLNAVTASATVIIGGITFHDNAFADVLVDASPQGSGQFFRETASSADPLTLPADFSVLQSAVVGGDITEWASLRTAAAQLTVGFTDLVPFDGPGPDLAILEIGAPATISVTISGVTHQYTSQPSGSINMILVDLSLFGVSIAPAVTLSSADILNDIAAVGAVNSVPEPCSVALGLGGLACLAPFRNWRRKFTIRRAHGAAVASFLPSRSAGVASDS